MEVRNERDLEIADALVQLRGALDRGEGEPKVRLLLAEALSAIAHDWREDAQKVRWVKTLGIMPAAAALLDKYGL